MLIKPSHAAAGILLLTLQYINQGAPARLARNRGAKQRSAVHMGLGTWGFKHNNLHLQGFSLGPADIMPAQTMQKVLPHICMDT